MYIIYTANICKYEVHYGLLILALAKHRQSGAFALAMTSFRVAQLRKVSWSLPNGELQVLHDECISRHVDFLELQLKLQLYPKGDLDVLRKRASFFCSICQSSESWLDMLGKGYDDI